MKKSENENSKETKNKREPLSVDMKKELVLACTGQIKNASGAMDFKKTKSILEYYFGNDVASGSAGARLCINDELDGSKFSPLMTSVWLKETEISMLLLSLGASPVLSWIGGVTPIHLASANGNAMVLGAMLNSHPEIINHQNELGQTPLMCAIEANRANTARLLCAFDGVKYDILDNKGNGVLFYADSLESKEIRALILKNMIGIEKQENCQIATSTNRRVKV